jgi:predicted nucleotidyltransferase
MGEETSHFGLDAATIGKIQGALSRFPEIESAVIYGSRAKGNYKPGSDIDLSLMGETLTEDQLLQLENRLDDLMLPYQFDLNRFHSLQNTALIEHIERIGKVFYVRTA